jgi:hypothetical protein
MGLDVRLPIGGMFLVVGVLLAIYGVITTGGPGYEKSLDININLWWGLVMAVFGALMLGLALLRGGKKQAPAK